MAKTINPNSLWLDLKPSVSDPDWRRVVKVDEACETYIHGVGWWQQQHGRGDWQDAPGPGAKRKTRILRVLFVKQYAELGPLVDVGATRVRD